MSVTGNIKIFTGNAHPALAKEICEQLGCDLGKATTDRFSDGNSISRSAKTSGGDVFILQPTCPPTDRHLMELLIMQDAFVRARQNA
jgi:ribose-phosphate pyrophosphokinase